MASFLENLAAYVTGNIPDLHAVVGDRVFPMTTPQGTVLPYAVFFQISDQAAIHHAGPSEWGSMRLQWDLYARSYSEAHDAARALRAAFEGRTVAIAAGVEACFSEVEGELDEFDPEERIFRRSLDLLFEYKTQ